LRKLAFAAALGLSLAAASPLFAGSVVYQTGFESPTFTAGLPLVGQDRWAGLSVPGVVNLSPNAAIITTGRTFEGRQVVQVRGKDLVPDPGINSLTDGYDAAAGSYRRPVDFNVGAAGFPIVRVQAAVRVDGPHACAANAAFACSNFFSASVAARAVSTNQGTAGIGELAISSDGVVNGYSGDDNVPGCPLAGTPNPPPCTATFLVSAPVSLGEYHVLAVNSDFVNRQFAFCLDGNFLGGPFAFRSGADITNILKRGSLVTYARPDTAQLHKTSFEAHYDNFAITTLSATQTVLSCN
jgi:hypothetical protein